MRKFLAALDVGTTTIKCHIVDEAGNSIAARSEKVEILYPKPGYVEINPDWLWHTIVDIVNETIKESGISPSKIEALGISTQRCSVITWDPHTGKHYHNFITWKDLRADSMVNAWNSSLILNGLRLGSRLLYAVSHNKRYQAGSVLKMMNTQMTLRLAWALDNVPGLREASKNGRVYFGGVDSWLLYKLTGQHLTDVSSASASGMFDPFTMKWGEWAMHLFNLPSKIFPRVVDSVGDFGHTPASLFGAAIPISCLIADQAASLFGSGCIKPGDLKLTMGTGSFVNVNTGKEPNTLSNGLYPLVGWRFGSEISYVLEGASNDTGIVVDWARTIGLIQDPSDTYNLATSVKDSDGVYFIPAFSGLQAPIADENSATGFIGVKPTTRKGHLVRAMLESLVFRILLIYECIQRETKFSYRKIKVDGGVSNNDFTMQLLADLTGLEVERSSSSEVSILGVTFLAGLQRGLWERKEDILRLRHIEKVFYPNKDRGVFYEPIIRDWKRAIDRFKEWH